MVGSPGTTIPKDASYPPQFLGRHLVTLQFVSEPRRSPSLVSLYFAASRQRHKLPL